LSEADGMIVYRPEIEAQVFDTVGQQCLQFIEKSKLFSYPSTDKQDN